MAWSFRVLGNYAPIGLAVALKQARTPAIREAGCLRDLGDSPDLVQTTTLGWARQAGRLQARWGPGLAKGAGRERTRQAAALPGWE